jgi:Uma2 family endonuclease
MQGAVKNIPKELIYELVDGTPIYYNGYEAFLTGKCKLEEITGSSTLQAFLATELVFLVRSVLGQSFFVLSNELGIQFSKQSWRAADIAVISKDRLPVANDKYLNIPPEFIIEIDTKAALHDIQNPLGYYQEKTKALLDFGVQQVAWIFTDTQKVMLARQDSPRWELIDWREEVEIIPDIRVAIHSLLEDQGLL